MKLQESHWDAPNYDHELKSEYTLLRHKARSDPTECPSAAASASQKLSKSQRSRARSGRLHGRVRRSGLPRLGCQPHAPPLRHGITLARRGVRPPSRASGIALCITGLERNHAQHTITLPITCAPHNGRSYHAGTTGNPHNAPSYHTLHNGLLHDRAGITAIPQSRSPNQHQTRVANHAPRMLNGLRYWQVGGRGQCLGAGKTRSQKNARKWRRIPPVQCTLCSAAL